MSTTSFLPEDYLDQKAERRTNMISLTLFGIVMVSVFAAFLVTNRSWSQVRKARAEVNKQYEQAADQITHLNELEQQKNQMLTKAKLAAALVERVPRSILLAELINRMPPRVGMVKFELTSDLIKPMRSKLPASRGRLHGPARAMTREEVAKLHSEDEEKVDVPHYLVTVKLVGVAPTDVEVSRYMAELNSHPLLEDVSLEYSQERDYDGSRMREFSVKMKLSDKLDVRDVAPLIRRKSGDDLTGASAPTTLGRTASAAAPGRGG
jgi:Fimbrial assembly protein (PilN)